MNNCPCHCNYFDPHRYVPIALACQNFAFAPVDQATFVLMLVCTSVVVALPNLFCFFFVCFFSFDCPDIDMPADSVHTHTHVYI